MPGFEMEFDMESELSSIRGTGAPMKKEQGYVPEKDVKKDREEIDRLTRMGGGSSAPKTPSVYAEEKPLGPGFDVKQGVEERLGGSGGAQPVSSREFLKWKSFLPLPGLFYYQGGDRPIALEENIRKVKTEAPEPLLDKIQKDLKDQFTGAVVMFPWGEFPIEENNKVFLNKTSLGRFLAFDGLRDVKGVHVQYAKQWLALQLPEVGLESFSPKLHVPPGQDALDIYALLLLKHEYDLFSYTGEDPVKRTDPDYSDISEEMRRTQETMELMHKSILKMQTGLSVTEELLRQQDERNIVTQTILLLDRMGLLKGNLPQDLQDLTNHLEKNRELLRSAAQVVDGHVLREMERTERLRRQRQTLEKKEQYIRNKGYK